MMISTATFESACGNFVLWEKDGTLVGLTFPSLAARVRKSLERRFGAFTEVQVDDSLRSVKALAAYFAGDLHALDALPADPGGTAFQAAVWRALRRVGPGDTASYSDIANAVGNRAAVRAVGAANGGNPIAIVIPCHRIIGKDGSLTGYAGGLSTKKWLLAHESPKLPLFMGIPLGRVLPLAPSRAVENRS